MFRWLGTLFAEQTTPDEVIVFLILCVLLALLLSFALYALVLTALWHGRLRRVTTLQALLFPGRKQLLEYSGEYALALTTSILLTLTVTARHDAVRQVLDYPLAELTAADIQQAFPFGRVDIAELGESPDELARALAAAARTTPSEAPAPSLPTSIGVEALLLPTVGAGGADRASLWLQLVIAGIGEDPWSFPTRTHLLVAAVLMLVLYVGWFAWGRSRSVAEAGQATETDYARIAGRFLVPAVCIALLLVSAAGAADPQRIARSAVAAAGSRLEAEEAAAALYLDRAMQSQLLRGRRAGLIIAPGEEEPSVWGTLGRLDEELRAVRDTTLTVAVAGAETRRTVDALRPELDRLSTRFARDSARVEAAHLRLEQQDAAAAGSLTQLSGQLATLAPRVEEARTQASEARTRAGSAAAAAEESARGVAELGRRADALQGSLERLDRGLQELARRVPDTGLLLVVGAGRSRYVIRGPQGTETGVGVGLHALSPGEYTISTAGAPPVQRQIRRGEAETVQLQERLVDSGGVTIC